MSPRILRREFKAECGGDTEIPVRRITAGKKGTFVSNQVSTAGPSPNLYDRSFHANCSDPRIPKP